ncbi:MAG TPA: CDP-diacylglycerol--glycerol-3-phosphate 3-phosphatidyltransferase [Deltaproteobacteria bacterium]|nr:CDP-diacylglycerol--glycerol-3-phosphate 3-phosphatidyltransferase [Deltaproteobacteria bacterium]
MKSFIINSLNIPNLLTISRLLLVPFFVGLVVYEKFYWALVVFIIAGLTDALDGFIAKRFNLVTEFGRSMDPLADKFLLISAFLVLTIKGWIPLFLCILVILRDMLIVTGYMLLRSGGRKVTIGPSIPGKITTALQILTVIGALVLKGLMDTAFYVVVGLTTLFTVYSGVDYALKGLRVQLKNQG